MLLAHLTTLCFTLIIGSNIKDHTPDNTIPSWLLHAHAIWQDVNVHLDFDPIYYAPTNKPPFTTSPNLRVQIFDFTYCNDRFPAEATNRKVDEFVILRPLLS
jgi:hypothetical protein